MAAKKGKTKSAKVSNLKSKKLTANQADQVKGGLIISSTLAQKELITQKGDAAWKLAGGNAAWKFSGL